MHVVSGIYLLHGQIEVEVEAVGGVLRFEVQAVVLDLQVYLAVVVCHPQYC